MKFAKNKTTATTIALCLVLIVSSTLLAFPTANAHSPPWNYPSWSYVSVSPNPIGIGQTTLVVFWLNAIPPTSSGAYGDRWIFYVDITKPDKSTEVLGPFTSDPVGGSYTSYVPDQEGNYTFVARFPGQKLTGLPTPGGVPPTSVYVNDTYVASTSDPAYLTVQLEQIQAFQETPLPTQYWTRPINGMNRNWYQVASNWLGGGLDKNGPTTSFGYGKAPESAHIMWTRPYWSGGIMDERFGDTAYYTGMSYEDFHDLTDKFILDGKFIYNVKDPPRYGWYAIDLYTGETEYFHNTTAPITRLAGFDDSGEFRTGQIDFGQIFDYESPNQHGGLPYLWSTVGPNANTWMLFDGYTGNWICNIANVSATGTLFQDKIGSIFYANIVNVGSTAVPKYNLQIWNTSEAIWWKPQYGAYEPKTLLNGSHSVATSTSNTYWFWRPYVNNTFDGNNGFSMNVSISSIMGPANTISNQTGTIRAVRGDKFVIVGTTGVNNEQGVVKGFLRAYSLEQNKWGQVLWDISFTPPSSAGNKTISMGTVDPEDGVFVFSNTQLRQRWGYSLATGELLWGPTANEDQWMYYGMSTSIYQGKLLSYGYGGILTAYNITTGEILWIYKAGTLGFEQPYSGAQLSLGCIADGKIYLWSTEHSSTTPLARGQYLRCVDTTTGKEVWKITCWAEEPIEADGYIITPNLYDSQIYCFGKGPSAITVSAPQIALPLGSSVIISGTVTDQSSGAKGTPAISDPDQQLWMEYLYMQRPMPTSVTGVPVSIDVIDANGNYRNIGSATSDNHGTFSYMWQPDISGMYTIIASFQGSKSYYPSTAETAMGVTEAAPTASPNPEVVLPPTEMYILGGVAAIIIAIGIVGAILLLAIKKRP